MAVDKLQVACRCHGCCFRESEHGEMEIPQSSDLPCRRGKPCRDEVVRSQGLFHRLNQGASGFTTHGMAIREKRNKIARWQWLVAMVSKAADSALEECSHFNLFCCSS